MTKVYLSGPIDENDEAGARYWRKEATAWLALNRIGVLDPLDSKDESIEKSDYTPAELRCRDKADIRKCDVFLCNFKPKPGYMSWGTPSECEYAADIGKPVVFVCPMDSPLRAHPWSQDQAVRFFVSLSDACIYIRDYWAHR